MVALPGSQFFDTERFGQVQQLALSGDFGPLEVACGDAGTAIVSGVVASAGTFTADDSLSAIFCRLQRYRQRLVDGPAGYRCVWFHPGNR
jgi:hypothetical protein